ncbi:MAG: imidazole glycerol phosphate synthase subunit HisH [Clostridia bacterium]|nr:imidazole glycerol phosphate synthase subunit HisH [Clostridia bacterium]
MITIIDYDAGNLRSVAKALEKAGADTLVTSDEETILKSDAVVLPGVGAFADCMASLVGKGMDRVVKACVQMGKPFLGICLGYQMLFESSEEHPEGQPDVPGLGIFKGRVKRFPDNLGLKVPHMGWNSLKFSKVTPFFEGLPQNPYVYFVHSYYVEAADRSIVAAQADYGFPFDAAIARPNLVAMQFHPEKSGDIGHKLIENFLKAVKA